MDTGVSSDTAPAERRDSSSTSPSDTRPSRRDTDSSSTRRDTSNENPSDCTGTERYCEGRCVEMLSNPNHCGSCGYACSDGQRCINGFCKCSSGSMCGGECVDLTSNDDHCFKCGNACGPGEVCRKSVCVEADRKAAIVTYANQVRQTSTNCGKYGTKPAGPPLKVNAELEKAAQAYAEKMAKHGFFSHTDPMDGSDFVQRVARTNYKGTVLGENLSRGLRQSAQVVVQGWTSSDSHCRILANPNANEVGIGLGTPKSGTFDAYWVMLVGRQ